MSWIVSYGCTSAAGPSTKDFWQGLLAGVDHSKPFEKNQWSWPEKAGASEDFMAYANPHSENQKQFLIYQLLNSIEQIQLKLSEKKLGIILASTKGFIDDVIWKSDVVPKQDTIGDLLTAVLAATKLKPQKTACVSNACASSLAAVYLAENWFAHGDFDQILILAADAVGPFVLKGFQALRVLTKDKTRPFAQNRSGFFLGEASAAILLEKKFQAGAVKISGVGLDSEGYAVTRPTQSGESLQRAARAALGQELVTPDFILAHGTATQPNDKAEDHVFYELFFRQKGKQPLVTGTKWSIGHTLATSGALDLIAACEAIRQQHIFHLAQTSEIDSTFKSQYLLGPTNKKTELKTGLLTSLGFGGQHAAVLVQGEPI